MALDIHGPTPLRRPILTVRDEHCHGPTPHPQQCRELWTTAVFSLHLVLKLLNMDAWTEGTNQDKVDREIITLITLPGSQKLQSPIHTLCPTTVRKGLVGSWQAWPHPPLSDSQPQCAALGLSQTDKH
jgi:hypothetical protein